ncbi:MAG TPA: glutamyl-tRNA reductase [Thermomicrobiales bacterium]|nr:glutamyl-tRNA reductase [Thermomicrobiales bacterium]
MQLCMIGANHERAAIAARERLAFSDADIQPALLELQRMAGEGLILSTCNRTEVYALLDDHGDGCEALHNFLADSRSVSTDALAACTITLSGRDAARHLMRVACGLESMMLGESQILSQAQRALTAARVAGSAGPILSRLCMNALRTGKQARTRTAIARNRLSISHAAIDLAGRDLNGLNGRSMLVIGAGQIATVAARLLRNARVADLVIANRTEARGLALAADTGGRYIPLSDVPGELAGMDGLFAAAAAPGYVLDVATTHALSRGRATPLVAVDLAVPRTIEPALGDTGWMRLYSVDDLQDISDDNRSRYEDEIAKVEAIVERATSEFMDWWRARSVVPAITALHERAETIRRSELERAMRRLGHLSERDRAMVEALSTAIVNKMLHYPVTRVKAHAETGRHEQSSERLLELFGLGDSEK